MDQIFLPSSNGVPSESKLATYMVTPQSPEFIPSSARVNSSPNFHWPGGSNGGLGLMHNNGAGPSSNHHNSTSSSSSGSSSNNNNGHIVKPSFVNPLKGMSFGGSNSTVGGNSKRSLLRNCSPESLTDSPRLTPQSSPPTNILSASQMLQENVNGSTYFYPAPDPTINMGQDAGGGNGDIYQMPVHMYPGPAAHVLDQQPKSQLFNAFFMGDELRQDLQSRNTIANAIEAVPEHLELPMELDNYHALTPLEPMPVNLKMPVVATLYRATHSGTGVKYCLRRIHGFRLHSTKCMSIIESWKKLQHSNVVQLREVFTTKACGDNSLILVYDYHAGSQTLLAKYFTPTTEHHLNGGGGNGNGYTDPFGGDARPFSHKSSMSRTMTTGPMLPENEIWSLIMQITAGLKAIHQAGLACRTLDPTKIIITGKRVRFSCLGVTDIISFDPNQTNQLAVTNHYQQEDLTSLGKLVLALACRSLHVVHRDQMQSSLDLVGRHYSSDLNNLIFYLFSNNVRSVSDLMPMIGARFYTQLDALQTQCDMYQDELAKDMENGRLYRLLVKLNFINERPEFNLDPSWSETGDRYMLKLFRDYLFHSVADDGRPWLDHAHIVQCLNRLDAGTLEKVQLISRDEQSVLVVTYAELKHCLEQSFSELLTAS